MEKGDGTVPISTFSSGPQLFRIRRTFRHVMPLRRKWIQIMRTAVYVRVSTQRQVQSQTIEQQLERLHNHIDEQGWTLLDENIFRDDGLSGSTLKRPGLDRLRDRAAEAVFDRILITAPDRLARKYVHQVLVIEELEQHGCQVEFLDRPMSQDPHDQLVLQMRGAVAEFDLVQGKLAQNQSFATRHNTVHQYLLRALVSCGICQLSCCARTVKESHHGYYVCSGKAKPVQNRREEKCPSRFIPAQQLDDLVWQDLCDLLLNPQSIAWAMHRAHAGQWLPQQLQSRQQNLLRGQRSLEQQLKRLTDAYLAGVIPLGEYQRRRQEIEDRIRALQHQLEQLLAQVERHQELAGLVTHVEDFCQRIQTSLANPSFEQKRQLVELLVDRVVVTDSSVEIRYAIPTSLDSEIVRFCHLRTDYFNSPDVIGMAAGDVA